MQVQGLVREQYETWPYPSYPLFAKARPRKVWQLNAAYLADRCGVAPPPERARIWIAGCGTLQPHVFATANPGADVLATDLSQASLRQARRRCRWHGQRHVRYAPVDLADTATLPDGPFDLIECYGVLMCLPDPAATLRELAARLAPHGVLRLMVYPHFSRQRIFQVQRVAKLLGLHHNDRSHPRLLRQLVAALPRAHPLRHAFVTYDDARDDAGLADAFLHPHDRGFTGLELGAMVRSAGLAPGFFFQRPFAQPAVMAGALGFGACDPFAVLHYLDLWQELRGNFVVCLRRERQAGITQHQDEALAQPSRLHPLLSLHTSGVPLTHRARVLWGRLAGVRLDDRTAPSPWVVAGRTLRAAVACEPTDAATRAALHTAGVLLAAWRASKSVAAPAGALVSASSLPLSPPRVTLWRGRGVPNPLYAHLYAAWTTTELPGLPSLGSIDAQMARWDGHAEALEDAHLPFGLTPAHTYRALRPAVDAALTAASSGSACAGFAGIRLRGEAAHVRALAAVLARAGLQDRTPACADRRRELCVLLVTHAALSLDVE